MDKAGNIIANIVDGAADATGNILNEAGKVVGNIFGISGNVLQKIVDAGTGIIGKITQLAGTVLQVPITIFGQFSKLLTSAIGKLGSLSADLINKFGNAINSIANIGKGIASLFNDFFTTAIGGITDFIVNPALKAAKTAYDAVVAAVTTAIDAAKTNIATLVDAFDADLKAAAAAALNSVSNLAADLNKQLNDSKANATVIAKCGAQLKDSLQTFAENAVPYLSECIEPSATFNVTDLANKAVASANGTLAQAKAVVAQLQKCIDPVLANPKDSAAKTTAKNCLTTVSYNYCEMFFFFYYL